MVSNDSNKYDLHDIFNCCRPNGSTVNSIVRHEDMSSSNPDVSIDNELFMHVLACSIYICQSTFREIKILQQNDGFTERNA